MVTLNNVDTLRKLLKVQLKPLVTAIDHDSIYPEEFLNSIGKAGLFAQDQWTKREAWTRTLSLIEETSAICGSTAFVVWCHTTSLVYVRNGNSTYLKEEIYPKLARGELLGATGLSNPMKFYAGMEPLCLKAKRVDGGYRASGFLPFISNLGSNHWFGIVAEIDETHRMMAFVPANAEGIRIVERKDFIGLNGSATFNSHFQDVVVPDKWVLADDADSFIRKIQPEFVLNQVGMGLGLARTIIKDLRHVQEKQGGANKYLKQQPDDLADRLNQLRERAYRLIEADFASPADFRELLTVRLESSYLALDAANAGMLHHGGAAFVQKSGPSRRLREALFVAVVTPAVKQLEKVLRDGWTHL